VKLIAEALLFYGPLFLFNVQSSPICVPLAQGIVLNQVVRANLEAVEHDLNLFPERNERERDRKRYSREREREKVIHPREKERGKQTFFSSAMKFYYFLQG